MDKDISQSPTSTRVSIDNLTHEKPNGHLPTLTPFIQISTQNFNFEQTNFDLTHMNQFHQHNIANYSSQNNENSAIVSPFSSNGNQFDSYSPLKSPLIDQRNYPLSDQPYSSDSLDSLVALNYQQNATLSHQHQQHLQHQQHIQITQQNQLHHNNNHLISQQQQQNGIHHINIQHNNQHIQQQQNSLHSPITQNPATGLPSPIDVIFNHTYKMSTDIQSKTIINGAYVHPGSGSSSASALNDMVSPPIVVKKDVVQYKKDLNLNLYVCRHPKCMNDPAKLRTFAKLFNLKSHMMSHSTERPFVCKICKVVRFQRKHDLQRHVKCVHQTSLPQCTKCRQLFESLLDLEEHKKSHIQGEKIKDLKAYERVK